MPLGLTILLFARARELVGTSSVSITIDTSESTTTLAAVRVALISAYPALVPLLSSASTLLALNASYVESEETSAVSSTDEIAVIPPVSGG